MAEPTFYLFDGFNLLHASGFEDPRELTDKLASFVAEKGARGVLVFDGSGEDLSYGPLEVRFAEDAVPPIASVLLVVGAGGGFGRVLDAAGAAKAIAQLMGGLEFSPLVLGWVIASVLRLAVGSATVAVVTAASIMAPIAAALPHVSKELLVVAIGAGSAIASHVNDGGFWLVKEYLNMSVPQTIVTWTVLETIVAVAGLAGVLVLAVIVR